MSNKRFAIRLSTCFLISALFTGVLTATNVYASVQPNEFNTSKSDVFSTSTSLDVSNDAAIDESVYSQVLYTPEPQQNGVLRPLRDTVLGRVSQIVFPEMGNRDSSESSENVGESNVPRGRATIREEQKKPPFFNPSELNASKYSQQASDESSSEKDSSEIPNESKSEDVTTKEQNVEETSSAETVEQSNDDEKPEGETSEGVKTPSIPLGDAATTEQDDIVVDVVVEHTDVENNSQEGVATSGKDVPDAPVDLGDITTPEENTSTADVDTTETKAEESTSAEPVVNENTRNESNVTIEESAAVKRTLGYENAEGAVRDMVDDVVKTLKNRNGYASFQQWQSYNAQIRKRTNGLNTGNELNSLCRLKWYDDLYSNPLTSVGKVERASRVLAQNFTGDANGVLSGVYGARQLMSNLQPRTEHMQIKTASVPDEALDLLKATLVESKSLHAKALAPLNDKERGNVVASSYKVLTDQVNRGHTTPEQYHSQARNLIASMDKINKTALYEAGEQLLATLDPQTLAALSKIDFESLEKVTYTDNQQVGIVRTEAGDILVGGRENNVWNLDSSKYRDVCCVIDLGGSDKYIEGDVCLERPLLLVIDLGNDSDVYDGRKPGIQGGAVLGVSVWFDEGGDDFYRSRDIAQGSAVGGFGALIDADGNDRYLGFRRVQGAALCGFGLLLDRNGNDDYRAALLAQGFGAPGGFGALVDGDGSDHYYVGGYFFDSYPEHPGYDGWGQGIGAGIRRVACGGIGALLDCGGSDAYEFDYFGHGGGYWMGIGFARDFGGNDFRYAATSSRYDGSRRTEGRWQRFGCGFGCHYAVGYLFDDEGDDAYGGTIMGVGMGWDLAAGFLVDFDGDDYFGATRGRTQGNGSQGSIGAILNYRGDDRYFGQGQGWADSDFSYHAQMNCGSNFSFVVDHGGKDVYGCGARNNEFKQRGRNTGFILDRPAPDEEKASSNGGNAKQTQNRQGQRPASTSEDERAKRVQELMNGGMPTKEQIIKTQAAAPPQYDTNVHSSSEGINAFNSQIDGGGFFGPGLFRRAWGN